MRSGTGPAVGTCMSKRDRMALGSRFGFLCYFAGLRLGILLPISRRERIHMFCC